MKKLLLVLAVAVSSVGFGQSKKTTTHKVFQPPYKQIIVKEIIEPGYKAPSRRYLLEMLFNASLGVKQEFKIAQQFTYNKVRSTSIFDWDTQILLDRDKWLDTISVNRYMDFDKYEVNYMMLVERTNISITQCEWFWVIDKQSHKIVRSIRFLYKNDMELIDVCDSDIKNVNNYKR
tara:strand:- start:638 stop:1165 length:528 start_codon:yes stop_codon:yes gene_type:complete